MQTSMFCFDGLHIFAIEIVYKIDSSNGEDCAAFLNRYGCRQRVKFGINKYKLPKINEVHSFCIFSDLGCHEKQCIIKERMFM